jgi:hypothetical protein
MLWCGSLKRDDRYNQPIAEVLSPRARTQGKSFPSPMSWQDRIAFTVMAMYSSALLTRLSPKMGLLGSMRSRHALPCRIVAAHPKGAGVGPSNNVGSSSSK